MTAMLPRATQMATAAMVDAPAATRANPAAVKIAATIRKAVNGIRVLNRLTPITAQIPVVALTAHALKGDQEKIITGGFSGYLAKPIDTRTFVEQVLHFSPPHVKKT